MALLAITLLAATGIFAQAKPLDTPAAELALRLDGLLDQVEEPKVEITQATIAAWTVEILPYFEYEGITSASVTPDSVKLTLFPSAMENFHVLGQAFCDVFGGGPVDLNGRVANPTSAWYDKPFVLATLVHELGHIQGGGLCSGSSAELESTTQLVALEVLAAMANGGNELALYALLDELRDMAMGAAHYEAIANGNLDGYRALVGQVFDAPDEQARAAKSARRWSSDPATLREILYKYSWIPVDKILDGLEKGQIPDLKLAPVQETFGFYGRPSNPRRPLVIDDLAYVLEHADELLRGPR